MNLFITKIDKLNKKDHLNIALVGLLWMSLPFYLFAASEETISSSLAGLINGNIFVSEMIITETGSIRGTLEAQKVEINGHVEGKITADTIIVGSSAVIKGDVFFKNTLKTEEGADIDGYIKRLNNGKVNSEEDIAIEEIVERAEPKKAKIVHVVHQKKAV